MKKKKLQITYYGAKPINFTKTTDKNNTCRFP